MNRQPHFVVVGGGTAGWIAAFIIQDAARRKGLDARISVIEPSSIPTVGVGEATTAAFRVLLKHFGSLKRLRIASVEEIASVPGMGDRTAAAVVEALAVTARAVLPTADLTGPADLTDTVGGSAPGDPPGMLNA